MQLQEQIISAINTTLKNANLFKRCNYLISKALLKNANFVKKRKGANPYLVVLHFVYMLVMNKKISTYHESKDNDSLK